MHQKTQATELVTSAASIHAAKGKKIVAVDQRKTDLTTEDILKLVLGPTGNLRAPTMIVGKKMIVGFNETMYQEILG